MRYAAALEKAVNEAPAAVGMTREEIEQRIAAINAELKRPVGDAMRIMLCSDRASLRKALDALKSPASAVQR